MAKGELDKNREFIDLMIKDVGRSRHKAIMTLMKRRNMSYEQARKFQAEKIVESKRKK